MGINFKRLSTAVAVIGLAGVVSGVFAHLPSGRSLNLKTVPNSSSKSRFDFTVADASPYSDSKEYQGGEVVESGDFEGTKTYWTNAWWSKGEKPGEFADSGGTSPWGLINSKAFGEGSEYQWVGWNSAASKWEVTHDNEWNFTETQVGDWGDQLDKKGPGAYLPTWRDGAEGCYSMIHDDIGAMSYEGSVEPANEVGYEHERIRVAWGVKVDAMDATEWGQARTMVLDGHEMVNHSYDHTSAADQWQWFYQGDKLPNTDPSIPKEIMNLDVDSSGTSWKSLPIQVPYINYKGGDVNQPETLYNAVTFQVSNDYEYKVDSTFNAEWGEYEYTYVSTGKIKAEHNGWSDAAAANVKMLKVFCVPGWTDTRAEVNIKGANDLMNQKIYEQVDSPRFPKDKRCEYYVYPYDAYSNETHDMLYAEGIIASRGGAKSGTPLPGDFFHPFRIDFDAFFMLDANAETVFPDNPHQRISLKGLVDRVWKTKGYMIREFHACADVDYWDDANDQTKGGWWGGIPKSLYKTHFEYLDELIDGNKITVETPTTAVQYRLTANSVSGVALTDGGIVTEATGGATYVTASASGCNPVYQDEISVIVVMNDTWTNMYARYADGTYPRFQPRKMDDAGKAWSVSVNPYEQGGKVFLSTDMVATKDIATKANMQKAAISAATKGTVTFNAPAGKYDLKIYNLKGRVIANQAINASGLTKTVNLNKSLANGQYIFNLTNGVENVRAKLMVR